MPTAFSFRVGAIIPPIEIGGYDVLHA